MNIKPKTNGCSGANAQGLYANTVAYKLEIYIAGVSKMLIWFDWNNKKLLISTENYNWELRTE